MAQLKIIPENCIACGLCALYAPDIFDYDDEGIVCIKDSNQTEIELEAITPDILKSYQKCPSKAIGLSKNL